MSRRIRIGIFLPGLAGLGALLAWAFAGLPDFGDYQGPYGFVLERIATPTRHITNVVNATTYDIRAVDTMGEEFILFAAVIGVVLLLRGGDEPGEIDDGVGSDLVRIVGVFAVSAAVLVGLWLVAFGLITPGGGFQGGVAIAAGVLLVYLVSSYRSWKAFSFQTVLDPLEGIGAGGYVVVGLAALVSGLPFLTNLLGPGEVGTIWSGGSAALVNWAAGLEVAAANLILYGEFLEEYIVPLARSR